MSELILMGRKTQIKKTKQNKNKFFIHKYETESLYLGGLQLFFNSGIILIDFLCLPGLCFVQSADSSSGQSLS